MVRPAVFTPRLAVVLPATHALLLSANLTLDDRVSRVVLHGSRGLAGGSRPDSDVDLSLIAEHDPASTQAELEDQLREITAATLDNWRGTVEVDLAVVFDRRGCGLMCFAHETWDDRLCTVGGVDCFGLFKIQKGFGGIVTNAGVQVGLMHPCLMIWQRS
ncbi:MAG: hypothetical protein NT169_01170 [Chloroflexi bacterium]|nr:hypothetical protein [Chloroflexota bacterium]